VAREVAAQGDGGDVLQWRTLGIALAVMLVAVAALHWGCLALISKDQLDPMGLSDFYPLSVFRRRTPGVGQLGVAALYGACLAWAWPRLSALDVRLRWVLAG
jgi:hypothetical protein